jgi:hypothetical protein
VLLALFATVSSLKFTLSSYLQVVTYPPLVVHQLPLLLHHHQHRPTCGLHSIARHFCSSVVTSLSLSCSVNPTSSRCHPATAPPTYYQGIDRQLPPIRIYRNQHDSRRTSRYSSPPPPPPPPPAHHQQCPSKQTIRRHLTSTIPIASSAWRRPRDPPLSIASSCLVPSALGPRPPSSCCKHATHARLCHLRLLLSTLPSPDRSTLPGTTILPLLPCSLPYAFDGQTLQCSAARYCARACACPFSRIRYHHPCTYASVVLRTITNHRG